MKKVSILNFPGDSYEPIKRQNEIPKILKLITEKKEINDRSLISKWAEEKIREEEKFLTLIDPFEGLNHNDELNRKEKEIDDKHAIGNLGNKDWDKWRIDKEKMEAEHKLLRRKADTYWDSKRRIDALSSEIKTGIQKNKEIIPMLPTSLSSKHMLLINEEIEKYAEQGFDLDNIQLQQSEFDENGVLQKYYSSALMTWKQSSD